MNPNPPIQPDTPMGLDATQPTPLQEAWNLIRRLQRDLLESQEALKEIAASGDHCEHCRQCRHQSILAAYACGRWNHAAWVADHAEYVRRAP